MQQIILQEEGIQQLAIMISNYLKKETPEKIERVSVEQAAKELNMSRIDVYYGLIHKEIPIGFCKKEDGKKNNTYFIFRPLLDAFKRGELMGNNNG